MENKSAFFLFLQFFRYFFFFFFLLMKVELRECRLPSISSFGGMFNRTSLTNSLILPYVAPLVHHPTHPPHLTSPPFLSHHTPPTPSPPSLTTQPLLLFTPLPSFPPFPIPILPSPSHSPLSFHPQHDLPLILYPSLTPPLPFLPFLPISAPPTLFQPTP